MREIPSEAWNAPVTGTNLQGRTLAEEIGDVRTLLVFLRHLG